MLPKNKQIQCQHLGLIAYQEAWKLQEDLHKSIVDIKLANRNVATTLQQPTPNYLLFCEHSHVYTLGKTGKLAHLLASDQALQDQGIHFYHTNRGGDITYHGPGQLVVYPVVDLENFFTDLHRYLRTLEEAVIATLQDFGLESGRIKGLTGVWIDSAIPTRARKICAIGVRTSRWVTMHGLALNVQPNLNYFDQIIPCGVADKQVTSMEAELGGSPGVALVAERLQQHLLRLLQDG